MYKKIIINILLIVVLAVAQLSFLGSLPFWLNRLNIILVILIFILSLGGLNNSLWLAAGAGLLLDIFSFSAFGVNMTSLILTVLAANILLINFFTNRSLYSFIALIFFSTVIYKIFLGLTIYLYEAIGGREYFSLFNSGFFVSLGREIAVNLLAILIIFYGFNFASKKLKPVFLSR